MASATMSYLDNGTKGHIPTGPTALYDVCQDEAVLRFDTMTLSEMGIGIANSAHIRKVTLSSTLVPRDLYEGLLEVLFAILIDLKCCHVKVFEFRVQLGERSKQRMTQYFSNVNSELDTLDFKCNIKNFGFLSGLQVLNLLRVRTSFQSMEANVAQNSLVSACIWLLISVRLMISGPL
jgi:hypothetical protein